MRSDCLLGYLVEGLLALAFLVPVCTCAERLNILAIGQVMPGECLVPMWFDADPLVSYVLIPTDIDVMGGVGVAGQRVMEDAWRRYIRIYFPKTRQALVQGFEFIIFPDGYIEPFTATQKSDIRYALENGLGSFVTMGGDMSGPTYKAYPGWKNSILYELMPIELTDNMKQDGSAFSIKVLKTDPALLSVFIPFGIERVSGSGFTYLYPREGTTTWARLFSSGLPSGAPGAWLVSWKCGPNGGYFWTVADDLDHPWWSFVRNEYNMDIFLNILLYSTGRTLPDDILMVHELRNTYWRYNQEKLLLLSLLEFVDRFGGNTRSLEEEIETVDQEKERSFDQYRAQEFEEASNTIDAAIERMLSTSENAMKLKDRALLWVYITEWLAVTGTISVSGSVLYSLLVKRRLYKEVMVTRSGV